MGNHALFDLLFACLSLQLYLALPCLATPALCPLAHEGKHYSLVCTGKTTTHNRIVNWERETLKGYMTTLSSCSQTQLTPDCRDGWAPCEISHGVNSSVYSVQTCTSTVDNNHYFTSKIMIKEVSQDMGGLIFQCKVLDRDREDDNIFPNSPCKMQVKKHPNHHGKHHGEHHGGHHGHHRVGHHAGHHGERHENEEFAIIMSDGSLYASRSLGSPQTPVSVLLVVACTTSLLYLLGLL